MPKRGSFSADLSDEDTDVGLDENGQHYYDKVIMAKLPSHKKKLEVMVKELDKKIALYKNEYYSELKENKTKKSQVPVNSIPVTADIRNFNFDNLAETQQALGGRLFDVIMMDPPWQLSSSQPSRGVAIGYDSLSDDIISQLPVPKLQTAGF